MVGVGISVCVCVCQSYLKLASTDSVSFIPVIGTLSNDNEHPGNTQTFWESLFTHWASISLPIK